MSDDFVWRQPDPDDESNIPYSATYLLMNYAMRSTTFGEYWRNKSGSAAQEAILREEFLRSMSHVRELARGMRQRILELAGETDLLPDCDAPIQIPEGPIDEDGMRFSDATILPDGSAFATMSMPLPKDHWLYESAGEPPAGLRMGTDNPQRKIYEHHVREAARYAVCGATLSGRDEDFDPDAMVQNMVVGLLGYFTPDGTSDI